MTLPTNITLGSHTRQQHVDHHNEIHDVIEDLDPDHEHSEYVEETLADAKGDLLVASAADTITRLGVGTDTHVLTADATEPTGIKWAAATGGGSVQESLVDAKGDLLVASAADTITRLPVGTDTHVLTADATEPTGIKWAEAAAGGVDIPQQPEPPVGPVEDDLWIDTDAPASTTIYWLHLTDNLVETPTPTASPGSVPGLSIVIPASTQARMVFVTLVVSFSASHTNRFGITLDGALPNVMQMITAHQQGGDGTYDVQLPMIPISIPGDAAQHTIAGAYNAADSTAATTFYDRILTIMVCNGSSSPLTA